MPRPMTVVPVTRLGHALERRRAALGMTRTEASRAADISITQWNNLITQRRRFQTDVVSRAAQAVGLNVFRAWRLAGFFLVPDGARVITMSQARKLLDAS